MSKEDFRGTIPESKELLPRENCGLFGIIQEKPDRNIHGVAYSGLSALQHRGQEAWGFSWINKKGRIGKQKDLGLLVGVPEQKIGRMLNTRSEATAVMGHLRYSAVGKRELYDKDKDRQNVQPFFFNGEFPFTIAHNGTVQFEYPITQDEPSSDTYMVGKAIAEGEGDFKNNVINVLSRLNGAYTFLFMSREGLYVARDPWRFRPAILGRIENESHSGYVIASETTALRDIGAQIAGSVRRGAFAKIESNGLRELWRDPRAHKFPAAECSFEKAYFADDASEHEDGRTSHEIRVALGKKLAQRVKPKGDCVVTIPHSGISYAEGVAIETGIHSEELIQAYRFKGRKFIEPGTRDERKKSVFQKYRFIKRNIEGRRLIVVDDSIVRGHTTENIIRALFQLGAERVHLLSGIPPVEAPCHWGIDFPDPNELVYNQLEDGGAEIFEKRLALRLVGGDKKLAKKLQVSFQRLEDYISIIQNQETSESTVEHSGACFHCVSGVAPAGTIFSQNKNS
jgi:amidophosphoribosyltransferase